MSPIVPDSMLFVEGVELRRSTANQAGGVRTFGAQKKNLTVDLDAPSPGSINLGRSLFVGGAGNRAGHCRPTPRPGVARRGSYLVYNVSNSLEVATSLKKNIDRQCTG